MITRNTTAIRLLIGAGPACDVGGDMVKGDSVACFPALPPNALKGFPPPFSGRDGVCPDRDRTAIRKPVQHERLAKLLKHINNIPVGSQAALSC